MFLITAYANFFLKRPTLSCIKISSQIGELGIFLIKVNLEKFLIIILKSVKNKTTMKLVTSDYVRQIRHVA